MDGDERLYQSYRHERDSGLSHAQILELGLVSQADAERFALRFSNAASAYAEAMKGRSRYSQTEYAPDGRVIGVDDALPQRIGSRK